VAEPIIQQQGLERIVVQLPGVQDTARAKEILGAVATLEFRMVDEKNSTLFSINTTAIRWCKYFLVVFNIARPPILSKVMFTIGVLLS
jgi:preprotein translocase subunit SecD